MEKHAHRRRHVRVIGLGAVVIDPLLNNVQRGARIDLRRDRTSRGLNQHEQGDDQADQTHVMLPNANCQSAMVLNRKPVALRMANRFEKNGSHCGDHALFAGFFLKRLCDNSGTPVPRLRRNCGKLRLWRTVNA